MGGSPVFAGWMYVMTVLDEPSNPRGPAPLSLIEEGPATESPVLMVDSDGRDDFDFRVRPVLSDLSGAL